MCGNRIYNMEWNIQHWNGIYNTGMEYKWLGVNITYFLFLSIDKSSIRTEIMNKVSNFKMSWFV